MAYFFMFQRDVERFNFNKKHTDISPLGAAALAGTTFPIDRHQKQPKSPVVSPHQQCPKLTSGCVVSSYSVTLLPQPNRGS